MHTVTGLPDLGLSGVDGAVESNALEVLVHWLGRKLGPEVIRTVRGIGYMVPPGSALSPRVPAVPPQSGKAAI